MEKDGSFGRNLPEKRIAAGAISIAIWRNQMQRKDGTTAEYSTISIDRNYRDKDGNWKSTNKLRLNDLPKAAMALNRAYEYLIFDHQETAQQ
ncbi:MAG: hypothetical protein ACOCWQ_02410 [Nanoarchaeota archaeon]